MNVNKVKYNISNQNAGARIPMSTPYANSQTNFTGKINPSDITQEINLAMPSFIRTMKKIGENQGEVQNIIINALGTGLIAPVFIKWNPLSKTDEDTRTYSAWRQPVSAVLAVVTQAGITIPFNKVISNMANSGKFSNEKYNKTLFKDKNYIAKLIKKLEPNITKEELSKRAEAEFKKQDKTLLDSIRNKDEIKFEYFNEPKPKAMERANYKNLLLETLGDINKSELDEIKKCNKTKIGLRIQRCEYFRQNADTAKNTIIEIDKSLKGVNDIKAAKNILKAKIKQLKREKANKELINILTEINDRATGAGESKLATVGNWFKKLFGKKINTKEKLAKESIMLEEMKSKTSKIIGHINQYSALKSKEQVELLVKDSLVSRVRELEGSVSFLERVKKAITDDKKLSEIEEMFRKEIKGAKEHRLKDVIFGEKVVDKLKSNVKGSLTGYKAIAGFAISFAMLPVTCSLLNWCYPRFMDAFFPNLSNKKHSNVSQELVEKANKNCEVK